MGEQRPGAADKKLAALDRLVGTWRLSGGAEGTIRYRWLEGGHFLIQDLDLEQGGHKIKGIEVIGRERPFGAQAPGPEIRRGSMTTRAIPWTTSTNCRATP
jgi:hypothetical protein